MDTMETTTSTVISMVKKKPGDLRRDGDAAYHQHHGQRGQDQRPDDPGEVEAREVVVEHDLQEAAGDRDHRGHRDDVADPDEQRGGHGAGRAEGLADEGDEPAGRGLRPGELGERVAEQRDRDARGHDRQRRGDARGEGQEAEAEVEAHRGTDVGHRGRGDVDHAERAAA
jgi:hypothetical protein